MHKETSTVRSLGVQSESWWKLEVQQQRCLFCLNEVAIRIGKERSFKVNGQKRGSGTELQEFKVG